MTILNVLFILIFYFYLAVADNSFLSELNSPDYFAVNILKNLELNDFNVSKKCGVAISHYGQALSSKPRASWALQMFDAGSKIPSGVYGGNLADLGFFDQCLDVLNSSDVVDIQGKYCLGVMSLSLGYQSKLNVLTERAAPAVQLQLATCLPSICSASDIENIYNRFSIPLRFDEGSCQTKEDRPELDDGDVAMISFLSVILLVMVASTVYDAVIFYTKTKPLNPVLLSFSVITNGTKLLSTSSSADQISCLHGMRVITMMWIIMGHKYGLLLAMPIRNSLYLLDFITKKENLFLLNANIAVDTFFLLGGIVLAYTFMNAVMKGIKFNIVMYYIHRYIRLTPLLGVVLAFYLTLVKHFGSGPMWPKIVNYVFLLGCKENWWRNLLYIQNIDTVTTDVCVSQTWYLAVDFQLFLISPLLLIPLSKWPRITLILIGCLTGTFILATFLTAWFLELKKYGDATSNYTKYYYFSTWTRCPPWLIGLIAGYLIFLVKQKKDPIKINRFIVLLLWVVTMATLYACVFEGHGLIVGEYNQVSNSFSIAFTGAAWAVALSWIVFACVFNYGGPVNWFLSLPIFQVLSKLTYCMYLIHNVIILITTAPTRTSLTAGHSEMMYSFWGDYMYIVAVAVIFTLAFESPIIILEKFLFHRKPTKRELP